MRGGDGMREKATFRKFAKGGSPKQVLNKNTSYSIFFFEMSNSPLDKM